MKITSPYKIKKIIFKRKYPGYLYRIEIIESPGWDGPDLDMKNCYSIDSGHWIGNPRTARFLCIKKGLRLVQKSKLEHCVCSIGFNKAEHKWYGWSHRAIMGFGIGDRLFDEKYGTIKTPYIKHGRKRVNNMIDAKQAAINFAQSVS